VVVDIVRMDTRNLTAQKLSKNLDCKHIGLYKMLEVISPVIYQLQLLKDVHIHPVQPISHLSSGVDNPVLGQIIQ